MSESLFGHLALSLSPSPENLATEALCYVLRRSRAAREGLGLLLNQHGVNVPEGLSWATQVGGADGARPDLVALDGSGNQPIAIEAKFWAGLTDRQPIAYLDRPGLRALVFVAPAARSVYLWNELRRRCAPRSFSERPVSLDGARFAEVDGATLGLLSWRSLLASLQARTEAASDSIATADLAQLRGLCDRMDEGAFVPVTSEELTSHVYRRVVEFGNIVDDVTHELVRRGIADTKRLRLARGNGYYGRYFFLRGVGALLLCDIRKWQKYAATPLWLSVYGVHWEKLGPQAVCHALAQFEAEQPPKMFVAQDGFPTVPLMVSAGTERAVVVDSVVSQIGLVGELLAPLGAASAPSDALAELEPEATEPSI